MHSMPQRPKSVSLSTLSNFRDMKYHNFRLKNQVYAPAFLSFRWNVLIVLAIFFTLLVVNAKLCKLLKNQL